MTVFLGLSGYARSGKDTVANILALRDGVVRISFADALKNAIKALDPIIGMKVKEYTPRLARLSDVWNHEETDAENWERLKTNDAFNPSDEVRQLLQRMGTEVGRNLFGTNFWVEQAIASVPEDAEVAVFSDCRFPNEALAITERGGEMWRIYRTGYGPANDHPSETSLDGWDFDLLIINGGTIDDLGDEVDEQFEKRLGARV